MKKAFFILIILFLMSITYSFTQTTTPLLPRYVPEDSSKMMWEIGCGLGVPYGTIGGKFSVGTSQFTGDIGVGMLPFAWQPAISVAGVVHFGNRYANVRPKLTAAYSNVAAAILILESGGTETIFDETFSGFGTYFGVDWRLSKTSPLVIDLNIGWVFPSVGNDEIRKRNDEALEDLRMRGYLLSETKLSLNTPKVSLGVTYAPGRKLKLVY